MVVGDAFWAGGVAEWGESKGFGADYWAEGQFDYAAKEEGLCTDVSTYAFVLRVVSL